MLFCSLHCVCVGGGGGVMQCKCCSGSEKQSCCCSGKVHDGTNKEVLIPDYGLVNIYTPAYIATESVIS